MKKFILILLAVMTTTAAFPQDVIIDKIKYSIDTNTGNAEVHLALSTITTANIPASVPYEGKDYPVKSIGKEVFKDCKSLTSISIPNSVTSIGNYTFEGCSSIKSISIPNSVTSIGDGAFFNCSSLTSINIPNSVTSIGRRAFAGCYALTSVSIGNSVTSIREAAFYKCTSIKNVCIGSSVTSIGDAAFFNCSSLTSISIPNSVTSIGRRAFEDCSSIKSISIPNSVTSIGDGAFANCSSLTSINIPNSVTSIGRLAFAGCYALTSVSIGNSVTSIREGAFYKCTSIKSVSIPNSVTSIGERAFEECLALTSVSIGNSVTSIGENAFYECPNLKTIYCYAITPPSAYSDYYESFTNCSSKTLHVPEWTKNLYAKAKGWSHFGTIIDDLEGNRDKKLDGLIYHIDTNTGKAEVYSADKSIVKASIRSSVQDEGVNYPVTSIGKEAFKDCSHLTTIQIPKSVKSIDGQAFSNCPNLKAVYCFATTPPSLGTIYNVSPFTDCSSLTLHVPIETKDVYAEKPIWRNFGTIIDNLEGNGYKIIDGVIYYADANTGEAMVYSAVKSITEVNILSFVQYEGKNYPVTSIGQFAFEDCLSLTSISIPNSINDISWEAFRDCI